MNNEKKIIKLLEKQQDLLEQLHVDFRLLGQALCELAEQSKDIAEDEEAELERPEKVMFPVISS